MTAHATLSVRSCAVLVAAAVILGAAGSLTAQSGDRWISAGTSHFTIYSNADEPSVRRLAVNLERFVTVLSRVLGAKAVPDTPVTVVAFKDDRAFRPFKPLYNGKPGNMSGFFQRSPDEAVIALDISAARERHPFAVIFHEYAHLLTSHVGPNWPPWVVEGLAEFYSTFLVNGDEVTLGLPVADHVHLLREGRLLRLNQLIAVDRQSPIYNGGERQSLFYAESWALVHYLLLRNDLPRESSLKLYLAAMADDRDAGQAFRDTLGRTYPALEAELRNYVTRRVYPVVSYRLDVPLSVSQIDIRSLSGAEREWRLGQLLVQTDRLDEAEAFFTRASGLDPDAPEPYDALGLLALRRGQSATAIEQFARAAARNSRNPLARYAYADALYRRAPVGRLPPDQVTAVLAEARAAAALAPEFLPARHLMARVYLGLAAEADVAAGARAMAEARAAFPGDARIALTLGNLQMQLGDYAAAEPNLVAVIDSGDDTLVVQARYLLTALEEALRLAAARATSLSPPASPVPGPAR